MNEIELQILIITIITIPFWILEYRRYKKEKIIRHLIVDHKDDDAY